MMDRLRRICLEAYDRLIGLELSEVAVDCCITKAPRGGQKAGRNPVDRGKRGLKRSMAVDAKGIPLGCVSAPANRHDSPLLVAYPGGGVGGAWGASRGSERPSRRRLGLAPDSRAPGGVGAQVGDLWEGQAGALLGHVSVGGPADERVAQRPQEAPLVHGAGGEGDRLLGDVLGGGDHREEAHPRRLGSLPLGRANIPPTMSPIDGSSKDTEIVKAMIDLTHALGLKVIAEGVETYEQLGQLLSMECNFAQGYFSEPLPSEELSVFLAERLTDRG
jgi:hypothetical protein